MTRDQLRVADYLGHILEAIERIGAYTEDVDEVSFLDNKMIQDAVLRNIEIIGEAARNIERAAPDFAAQHSEIAWSVIYTMRNRIAHGYFKVDLEIPFKETCRSWQTQLARSLTNKPRALLTFRELNS